YGSGDPIEVLGKLAPRVMQVHLKDADPSPARDVWGCERPLGEGKVDWPAFFGVVDERLAGVNLVIEREAGATRVRDIRQAAELARGYGF
ncbi:MAG: TIM barrel protein, partial [Phycisphaerales bacterium]